MTEGDRVSLNDAPYITGVVIKLPRSEGRKRPRCVVKTEDGERWFFVDELSVISAELPQGE